MGTAWTFDWTPAAIERLRVLWFGGFSASECGTQMGCSRNAVIGVVHRRGWSRMLRRQRPPTSKAMRLAGPTLAPEEALPKPAAQLLTIPEQVSKPEPPIGSFGLMDLRYGVCKWPEGDAPPFAYCGDTALENGPYCFDHHRRAHQGPQHRALRPIESYAIRYSRRAA